MNELQQVTARAVVNVFETGHILGNYAALAVLKGDSGHLSYGRSQAALGSGALYELLDAYCQKSTSDSAATIRSYLPRLKVRDFTLDTDDKLKQALKEAAATDPIMRLSQDQFFDSRYLAPACRDADSLGIAEPLGVTVIYDSCVQGGWGLLKKRLGPMTTKGPKDWVQRYIALRRDWLKTLKSPLPNTVYRMDAFASLIQLEKWNLELPFVVHNVTITAEALAGDTATGGPPRTLRLTSPYLRGADVLALQKALQQNGQPISPDGVYGAFTAKLVEQWQRQKAINEDGVGSLTRRSLGLGDLH
ncbi:MAG: peptidoglycan-binding protein [Steroidobacteraceae bacterium]|jgi:chitosanase